MKKAFLSVLVIFLHFVGFSQNPCLGSYVLFNWHAKTKNRILKRDVHTQELSFRDIRINSDSLAYYINNLTETTDTLYNVRMYVLIECSGDSHKLYVDKSGVLEYSGKHYHKNRALLKYLFTRIPESKKIRTIDGDYPYDPLWLDDPNWWKDQ